MGIILDSLDEFKTLKANGEVGRAKEDLGIRLKQSPLVFMNSASFGDSINLPPADQIQNPEVAELHARNFGSEPILSADQKLFLLNSLINDSTVDINLGPIQNLLNISHRRIGFRKPDFKLEEMLDSNGNIIPRPSFDVTLSVYELESQRTSQLIVGFEAPRVTNNPSYSNGVFFYDSQYFTEPNPEIAEIPSLRKERDLLTSEASDLGNQIYQIQKDARELFRYAPKFKKSFLSLAGVPIILGNIGIMALNYNVDGVPIWLNAGLEVATLRLGVLNYFKSVMTEERAFEQILMQNKMTYDDFNDKRNKANDCSDESEKINKIINHLIFKRYNPLTIGARAVEKVHDYYRSPRLPLLLEA